MSDAHPSEGEKYNTDFEGRLAANAAILMHEIERFLNTQGSLIETNGLPENLVDSLQAVHSQLGFIVAPPEGAGPMYFSPVFNRMMPRAPMPYNRGPRG